MPRIGDAQRCRFPNTGYEFDVVVCDIALPSVQLKPTSPMPEVWQGMGR